MTKEQRLIKIARLTRVMRDSWIETRNRQPTYEETNVILDMAARVVDKGMY